MLRCDSVAPFGKPVVPEVYWMLTASSGDSEAATSATRASSSSDGLAVSSAHSGDSNSTTSRRSGHLGRASSSIVAYPESLNRSAARTRPVPDWVSAYSSSFWR